MLSLYQKCPRAWALKYLVGYREKDEDKSDALSLGSAIHEAIEEFFKTGKIDFKFEELHDDALILRAQKMFSVWVQNWIDWEDKWELLQLEQEYQLNLTANFVITMRVDRIMKSKETGFVYIVDTKTTGASLEGTERNYNHSPQPLLYHSIPYVIDESLKPAFRGWLTDIVYQRGKADAAF
jgi:ATP-dependent helicase/DNAse subunit B